MAREVIYLVILVVARIVNSSLVLDPNTPAIDQSLYEEALDSVLCEKHLNYIQQDLILRLQFLDSGIRTPKGILDGNTLDLGNYFQCLGINRQLEDSEIQGKYCLLRVPINQTLNIPQIPGLPNIEDLYYNNEIKSRFQDVHNTNLMARSMGDSMFSNNTRLPPNSMLASMNLRLAVCIPKTCTTHQALASLLLNNISLGLEYTEEFCRLPNDKPWAAADYVAITLFSLIGLVSLLSTVYDLLVQFVYKNGRPKSIYTTFSVYTNGQRLMNFSAGPDALDCVDGIRALAMAWVLVGHAFTAETMWMNVMTAFEFLCSPQGLWLSSAHIAVDTFFTLSGLLVVYTTVGKLSGMKLLRNLHFFYLNRLLRMFPVLAAGILLEASFYNWISDGPNWSAVTQRVDECRSFWWSTLLHIQNYVKTEGGCIGQTWYLGIDVQLHIMSPIVLFWVLSGSKKIAWLSLAVVSILQMIAATIYVFIMKLPSTSANPSRFDEMGRYLNKYYTNTLTRASPFLIGMIIGYILALYRGKRVRLTKVQVIFNWAWATALFSFIIYSSYPILQLTWDNQTLDSLYNSFIRPLWAVTLGWLIFACVHGYAGPINWFLSLRMWKLPARLSYAAYILHYGLMFAVNSSATAPRLFSVEGTMFKFMGHLGLTLMLSFIIVLFIDAPFSVLIKKLLSSGPKSKPAVAVEPEVAKGTDKEV